MLETPQQFNNKRKSGRKIITLIQVDACYFRDNHHKAPSYAAVVDPCKGSWLLHILEKAWINLFQPVHCGQSTGD